MAPDYLTYLTEAQLRYDTFSGIFLGSKKKMRAVRSAKNMYNDNAWDGGYGYIGALPTTENEEKDDILSTIKRQFTPRNGIKEVSDRVVNALLAQSPNWETYNNNQIIIKAVMQEQRRAEIQQRINEANKSVEELLTADPTKPIDAETLRPSRRKFKFASAAKEKTGEDSSTEETSVDEEETDERLTQAEMILSHLWTRGDLGLTFRKGLLERLLAGEGNLRQYINKRYKEVGKDKKDFEERLIEACKYVGLEFVETDKVKVIDDDGDKLSVTRIERQIGKQTRKSIELTFVDNGLTYIATFKDASNLDNSEEAKATQGNLDTITDMQPNEELSDVIKRIKKAGGSVSTGFKLDKHILVHQIKGDPYITASMVQQNRALTLALSLGVSVLVESGFGEMVITNTELRKTDGAAGTVDDGTKKAQTKYTALKRGPSTVNNLIGKQSVTEDGTIVYESPGVYFKDPTPIEVFDEGAELYYRQLLAEAKQEFVLMVGDSTTTGESRIQSRQDFLKKCFEYKSEVDRLGSDILTTFLHLIAAIAGDNGYFEGISVNFDCQVSAGELSAAEQQVIVSRYELGLISRETALIMLGTEDPLLEIDKIRLDEAEKQDVQIRRLVASSRYSALIEAERAQNEDSDDSTGSSNGNGSKTKIRGTRGSPTGGLPGVPRNTE